MERKVVSMRKKSILNAKLIITVESDRKSKMINTVSVFDNRTNSYWTEEQIRERGIDYFLDVEDMKQTLNWNLNGDSSKYAFKWGQSCKAHSEGIAYIF